MDKYRTAPRTPLAAALAACQLPRQPVDSPQRPADGSVQAALIDNVSGIHQAVHGSPP